MKTLHYVSVKVANYTETYLVDAQGRPLANMDAKGHPWFNQVGTRGKSGHVFHLEGEPQFAFHNKKELGEALNQCFAEQISLEEWFQRKEEDSTSESWELRVDEIYTKFGRLNADRTIPQNVGRAALIAALTDWLTLGGGLVLELNVLREQGFTTEKWLAHNKSRRSGSPANDLEQALNLLKSL